MQVAVSKAKSTQPMGLETQDRISALEAENQSLKQQLDWFKRQLFGRKSEKRLIDNPDQLDLSALLGDAVPASEPPSTEEIQYTRRKGKQRGDDCVTDAGLRFDDRVPVESIELSAPQLQGPEADQYEIVDYKVTRKLAQRPGSYVVLEYRRPVLKHKPSATLTHYTQRAIELLRPIYDAQWQHVLQSKVLAMDEISTDTQNEGLAIHSDHIR
jgi:hypothetical protein